MRTYLDCYPCFLRQGLDAARRLAADDSKQKLVLDSLLDLLRSADLSSSPPKIGDQVHRLVRRMLGDGDPYRLYKEATTREEGPRLFFLLQAKCPVLARDLGVSVGSIVLRQG